MNRETFDTDDEYFFALWLEELKGAGYVDEWHYEPNEIKLTSGLKIPYEKTTNLETKTKVETKWQTVFQPSVYTPDFQIIWNNNCKGLLWQELYSGKWECPFIATNPTLCLVELKPTFDSNNMVRLFKNNQKFIWATFNIYINLIDNLQDLFDSTFTPQEYTLTTKTKKPRKLKYIPKSLNEFLQ